MNDILTSLNQRPVVIGQTILGCLVLAVHMLYNTAEQAALAVILLLPH